MPSPTVPTTLIYLYALINYAQQYTSTSQSIILIHQFEFTPSDISIYYATIFTMWTIRPVYAYISDNWIIQNGVYGRRKPYIIIGAVTALIGTVGQYSYIHTVDWSIYNQADNNKVLNLYVLCSMLINMGMAISSMCLDTISVEFGNKSVADSKYTAISQSISSHSDTQSGSNSPSNKPLLNSITIDPTQLSVQPINYTNDDTTPTINVRSSIQSRCMFYRTCGSTSAAFLSILSLYIAEPDTLILINTIPFILAIIVAVNMIDTYNPHTLDHTPHITDRHLLNSSRVQQYKRACYVLWRPMIFLFIYNVLPDSADAYNTYLYSEYRDEISAWQYSMFDLIGLLGSLSGVTLYTKLMTRISLTQVFVIATLLACATGFTQLALISHINLTILHLPNTIFVPLINFIISLFASVASIPPLVIASESCPAELQLEGTMFSLYQAVNHVASLISAATAAQIALLLSITNTNFNNLYIMIIMSQCLSVIPLCLLRVLHQSSK